MALSYRTIRRMIEAIRLGWAIDHPNAAGSKELLERNADKVLYLNETYLSGVEPGTKVYNRTRHLAWLDGNRSLMIPNFTRDEYNGTYLAGVTTHGLLPLVRRLCNVMYEEAINRYSRCLSRSGVENLRRYNKKKQFGNHINLGMVVNASPEVIAATGRNTTTHRKYLLVRRSDSLAYEAQERSQVSVYTASILARLNRYYAPMGSYENNADVPRKFFDLPWERNLNPETITALDPKRVTVRGVPKKGHPLFWMAFSRPRDTRESTDDIDATLIMNMAWKATTSHPSPNPWDSTGRFNRPFTEHGTDSPVPVIGLTRSNIRTCSETNQPWLATHCYQGTPVNGRARYFANIVYDPSVHGLGGLLLSVYEDFVQTTRRNARNGRDAARTSNLEAGLMLQYSASPVSAWDTPGWFGHNGPTEKPETREDSKGRVRSLRYLGVELEVGYKIGAKNWKQHNKIKWTARMLENFAISKSDGSIAGVNGFEIVSRPAVLPQQIKQWDRFLNDAYKHVSGYGHNTCGMHVHVSKAALSTLQIGRMIVFVNEPKNRDFIARLAGRIDNRYSKMSDKMRVTAGLGYNGSGVIPSNFRTQYQRDSAGNYVRDRYGERIMERVAIGPVHTGRGDDFGKYSAINTQTGKGTIEFRIFKSNVSKAGFLKNLEFVDALCVFAIYASNQGLKVPEFISFVESRAKAYPWLTGWLRKTGYLKDTTPTDEKKIKQFNIAPRIITLENMTA